MMKQKIIRTIWASILFLMVVSCSKNMEESVVCFQSKYAFDETVNRLQSAFEAENITVFSVIDHSGEAQKTGMELRPTKVLVVGNPKAGTPLMQENQKLAIELPLKVLVTENEKGDVMVSYKKSSSFVEQYQLTKTAENTMKVDEKMIKTITEAISR